jgi:phage regulator Rha-like protein
MGGVFMKMTATTSNTTLIINGSNNQICISSLELAKEFGRPHKNVLPILDELLADGIITWLESKPRNYIKLGRTYRYFELNQAGFLKAMPFIGGKRSREGQKRLVDAFLRLQVKLERQSKEKEKLSCQIARLSGKDSRAILCDEIQKFIDYAKSNGSGNADRYYANITSLMHSTLIIIEPKATKVRELLTAIQLSHLSTIELTAAQVLSIGMESSSPYKEIYQNIKNALVGFSAIKCRVLDS